jgi:outer membrane protein OmpA-like peptidoglycan-associated protein
VCWGLCVLGCAAPQEQVVLVEPLGGPGGSVTVEQGTQSRTLTAPLASVEVRTTGLDTRQRSAADVQTQFGATLEAIPALVPAPARAYVIGFASGAADLPQDAEPTLTAILADVATHGVGEVAIIGHTDTVGSRAANERLAQARAVTVRDALLARGLYARRLHVDGHGERALLVPTADHVAEPRNRRVEIRVQ